MPEADAVATTCSASELPTPGAIVLPSDTLAGASMACAGTLLPSGRVGSWRSPADAVDGVAPRRLAVQAADSSAIGTSAVAVCRRPNRFADIELSPCCFTTSPPDVPHTQRLGRRWVTWHRTAARASDHRHPMQRPFPARVTRKQPVSVLGPDRG